MKAGERSIRVVLLKAQHTKNWAPTVAAVFAFIIAELRSRGLGVLLR